MKKILKPMALLLALLMALPMFACANGKGDGDESKRPSASSGAESSSSSVPGKDESEMTYLEKLLLLRDEVSDGIENVKCDGATITIDCQHGENVNHTPDWIVKEEVTADQINNALYERQTNVEARFDVNIDYVYLMGESESSINDYISVRVNTVRSGLGDVDIISVTPWGTSLMLEAIFDDMNQLEHLDFTRPWWFTDTIKDFTLGGHTTVAFGSCTPISIFGATEVCYFNQQLLEDYGFEDMYQVVREGRWTYDYLNKIAKDYQIDTNGNDIIDEGDIYGFKYNTSFIRMYWNFGGKYCELDETGFPKCNLNTPLNEEIFNKCRDLIGLYDKDVDGSWFGDGYLLMYATSLSLLMESGSYDFNVGVLPMPKLNETQKEYLSNGYLSGVGITIDSQNPNVSALVLEALAYYGWYSVVPKYYETIIKFKYSSDPRNAEMLDIMYNNMYYDPIYMYDKATIDYLATYCGNPTAQFVSFIKRRGYGSNNNIKQSATKLLNKFDTLFGKKS